MVEPFFKETVKSCSLNFCAHRTASRRSFSGCQMICLDCLYVGETYQTFFFGKRANRAISRIPTYDLPNLLPQAATRHRAGLLTMASCGFERGIRYQRTMVGMVSTAWPPWHSSRGPGEAGDWKAPSTS